VRFFCAHATQFVEKLHRVAMKSFRAIQKKICGTNVQQNRFDSILLQSSATHFSAACDVF